MRLGFISTVGGGYSWAGSEEMWRALAIAALDAGHRARINIADSMANSRELDQLRSQGAQVFGRSAFNGFTRRLAQRGFYSRFENFVRQGNDLICLSMGAIADCVWMPDLLRSYWGSSIPWIIIVQANDEHIISSEEQREILRKFYKKAALVIFVSRENMVLAERQLAWRFDNATIVPNPIRKIVREPLPWPQVKDEKLRFAQVARLDIMQKRQDQLLEVLAAPEWKDRPWVLSFYGAGPDEKHIRSLVKHFGLEAKVEFPGHVRDFLEIWQVNHLHIFPTAFEGMPLALIESMFCGRPAVVTRAGGNAELIADGKEGFVSPGMHPEVIRNTMEQAWQVRAQWEAMGRAAFSKASNFIPANFAATMLESLASAARRHNSNENA